MVDYFIYGLAAVGFLVSISPWLIDWYSRKSSLDFRSDYHSFMNKNKVSLNEDEQKILAQTIERTRRKTPTLKGRK